MSPSGGSVREPDRSETEVSRFPVESRLLELTERERQRRIRLAHEISRIGSGLLVQEEFPDLVFPERLESPRLPHIPEIGQHLEDREDQELPGDRSSVERQNTDAASVGQSERQETFPDLHPHQSSETYVDDHGERVADSSMVPAGLGTIEEEIAFRADLQRRITEDGIRTRGTLARGGATTGTRKGSIGVDLDNKEAVSSGPRGRRFNTKPSGTAPRRALTTTRVATEGREEESDDNKPGEENTPDLRPLPGLRPLRLLSQQSRTGKRDPGSDSGPYRPRRAMPHQSDGPGIGLGLMVENRVSTNVRPQASASEDSWKIARDRPEGQTAVQRRIAQFEKSSRPSVSPNAAGSFQRLHPLPDGHADLQNRMFRPRFKPFPVRATQGEHSAKAGEERVGLGLIGHLSREKETEKNEAVAGEEVEVEAEVSSGRQTRTFTRGTAVQRLRLASQMGLSPHTNDDTDSDNDTTATTADTTTRIGLATSVLPFSQPRPRESPQPQPRPQPRPRRRPLPPLPVRPLPSLPVRPLPPLPVRPLPPLPVRSSSQLPLPSTLPPPPLSTPDDPSESVASAGSNSSQRIATPHIALFPNRPPPNILSKAHPSPASFSTMENQNRPTARSPEISRIRLKAMDDARRMQVRVLEECKKTNKEPPPYVLEELIGKGSFGRVYKGKHVGSAAVVAVKIIDIDESDTINPRNADSHGEFLKEVNALKILSEKRAKNINLVIDAFSVNQAMWMITELCGGGSVATLMKPTAPGGLIEKWIIPILREVAEAIVWVHEAGIIHRDIKCANVLVTEEGNVQLCDFGVAGLVESKIDKRSTIIGTPHWMAPELFGASPSYGREVDIWAFGSMVFEIATGLPPNVANGVSYDRLGSYLQNNTPRLEGGNYSKNLRNLVAYCLEEDPKSRPTIGQVQKHPYISNTSSSYPTSTLKALVGSFKVWESRGNSRESLFMHYGAQGPTPALPSQDDEWNFNGTEYFEGDVRGQYGTKDVIEAYGPAVVGFVDETTRPPTKVSRRRPPPEALSRLPTAPLEKIFDPGTMTTYEDNSRAHYGRQMSQSGPDRSDLPLRDDSTPISIRDTEIDLGGHDSETGLSSSRNMGTIKAGRRGRDEDGDKYSSTTQPKDGDKHNATTQDFSRPALSDPAETNDNRHTLDWKFPSMALPASADPELSKFPTSYEVPRPSMTTGSGGRPALIHHPTEPVGAFGGGLALTTQPQLERSSMRESLIDLDMSMPDPIPELCRLSTANSDVSSTTSEQMTSANPLELERHASLCQPAPVEVVREPSMYVPDESVLPPLLRNGNALQALAEMSDFSASDAEVPNGRGRRERIAPYAYSDDSYYVVNPGPSESREGRNRIPQYDGADERDHLFRPPRPVPSAQAIPLPRSHSLPTVRFPDLPPHPSLASLTGTASRREMTVEITRIVSAMSDELEIFKHIYSMSNMVQTNNSNRRIDQQDTENQ